MSSIIKICYLKKKLSFAWIHLLAFGSYPLSKIEFTFVCVTVVGVWVFILIYFKV